MNRLKDEDENAERSAMASETRQRIPLEELLAFPFRICSRHFSTKCADASTPIVPNMNLPEKPLFFREDLLPRLRRRYVLLSEMGYEDVDVDMLEPNGILISPRDDPICCRVPESFSKKFPDNFCTCVADLRNSIT
ncbi:hypothetical protein Aduo_017537 [Ancylostoma duodenale]